jgi:hypothetical protein
VSIVEQDLLELDAYVFRETYGYILYLHRVMHAVSLKMTMTALGLFIIAVKDSRSADVHPPRRRTLSPSSCAKWPLRSCTPLPARGKFDQGTSLGWGTEVALVGKQEEPF